MQSLQLLNLAFQGIFGYAWTGCQQLRYFTCGKVVTRPFLFLRAVNFVSEYWLIQSFIALGSLGNEYFLVKALSSHIVWSVSHAVVTHERPAV